MKQTIWQPVSFAENRDYKYDVEIQYDRPHLFTLTVGITSMLRQPWLSVTDYFGRSSIPLPDHLRLCELTEVEAEHEVPAEVRQAADMLGGIVTGNVLTPEDYECLTTLRKWIYRMEHER